MAHFHLRGALELAEKLSQLAESTDEIAFAMVDEAADVMGKELREAIRANTQKYGTGVLAEFIITNRKELARDFMRRQLRRGRTPEEKRKCHRKRS